MSFEPYPQQPDKSLLAIFDKGAKPETHAQDLIQATAFWRGKSHKYAVPDSFGIERAARTLFTVADAAMCLTLNRPIPDRENDHYPPTAEAMRTAGLRLTLEVLAVSALAKTIIEEDGKLHCLDNIITNIRPELPHFNKFSIDSSTSGRLHVSHPADAAPVTERSWFYSEKQGMYLGVQPYRPITADIYDDPPAQTTTLFPYIEKAA